MDEAIKTEEAKGYDVTLTAKKALSALALGLLAAMGGAASVYLQDPENVSRILSGSGLAPALTAAVVPLIVAGAKALTNYLKHGGKVAE